MAWIELHQSLWTHKKTIMMAALLDIDEIYAAAHMSKLWTWALDNAPDGDLSGLPDRVIAFGAGWKQDASEFVRAVIGAGWIDRDVEKMSLHDWYDYAGRLLEKKEANKERMRNKRATHVQRTDDARTGATEPNQTEPNQTEPNNTAATPATPPVDSDLTDQKFAQVYRTIESQLVMLNAVQVKDVEDFLKQGMEPELIGEAVIVTKRKSMDISYLWGILSNCSQRQILTRQAFLEDRQRFEQSKRTHQNKGHPRGQSGKPHIPIIQNVTDDPLPTEEEFEEMLRKAKKLDGEGRCAIAN